MRLLNPISGPDGCGTCRFFVAATSTVSIGDCHIARPSLQDETLLGIWPLVRASDYCGEYERRYTEERRTLCPAAALSAA
ncbi:hypothetical protein [Methylobacterium sp. E-046]|uniref:hypothetical protein n=1 Tax=Methylobacterium sp. E-046 TaxID=2836576 RepID=UPI001FB9A82B|nr:hypothetical protein [Methylobacterium sp. E-046]MCJ2098960.1 hypothetical protein [Methylobacterium sp. E-046]